MTDIGPFDHLAQVRSSAELAAVAHTVPDEKIESFSTMVEKIREWEAATAEAQAAKDGLRDSMRALDDAREHRIRGFPARTFMQEWAASVRGRV